MKESEGERWRAGDVWVEVRALGPSLWGCVLGEHMIQKDQEERLSYKQQWEQKTRSFKTLELTTPHPTPNGLGAGFDGGLAAMQA